MGTETVLIANFIPNPFASLAGTYQGLFYNAEGLTLETAGGFQTQVDTNGGYTMKLYQGKTNYSALGKFKLSGSATNRVTLSRTNVRSVRMQALPG